MASPIPNLQFQPYNPVADALDAYYKMGQAQSNKTQNQMNKAKLPYVSQQEQALLDSRMLANELSQYGIQQAKAEAPYYDELAALKPQQARAEVDYKRAIGQSSMLNAKIGELNYQMSLARQPAEMAKLEAERQKTMMDLAMLNRWMQQNGMADPSQGSQPTNTGQPGNNQATSPQAIQQALGMPEQSTQNPANFSNVLGEMLGVSMPAQTQPTSAKPKTFEDYISKEPEMDFGQSYMNKIGEQYMSQVDLAGAKARSEAQNTQDVKAYTNTMTSLAEDAKIASSEYSDLEAMSKIWNEIPEGQKGTFMGRVQPVHGKSKIYDSLKSGVVLNELKEQKGTASEGDRILIENKYPGRTFDNDSQGELIALLKIRDKRIIEKQNKFANNKNVPVEKLESAWNQYIQENSVFKDPIYLEYIAGQQVANMSDIEAANRKAELERKMGRQL